MVAGQQAFVPKSRARLLPSGIKRDNDCFRKHRLRRIFLAALARCIHFTNAWGKERDPGAENLSAEVNAGYSISLQRSRKGGAAVLQQIPTRGKGLADAGIRGERRVSTGAQLNHRGKRMSIWIRSPILR